MLQKFLRLNEVSKQAMPSDPSRRVPDAALVRVERELRHREMKIQAELISLRPLVAYD